MYITVIAYWIVGMPLGYMLGITLNGGARAMWIGIICGLTAAAILLNTRFYLVTRTGGSGSSPDNRQESVSASEVPLLKQEGNAAP